MRATVLCGRFPTHGLAALLVYLGARVAITWDSWRGR